MEQLRFMESPLFNTLDPETQRVITLFSGGKDGKGDPITNRSGLDSAFIRVCETVNRCDLNRSGNIYQEILTPLLQHVSKLILIGNES